MRFNRSVVCAAVLLFPLLAFSQATQPDSGLAVSNEEYYRRLDRLNKRATTQPLVAAPASYVDLEAVRAVKAEHERVRAAAIMQMVAEQREIQAQLAVVDQQLAQINAEGSILEHQFWQLVHEREHELQNRDADRTSTKVRGTTYVDRPDITVKVIGLDAMNQQLTKQRFDQRLEPIHRDVGKLLAKRAPILQQRAEVAKGVRTMSQMVSLANNAASQAMAAKAAKMAPIIIPRPAVVPTTQPVDLLTGHPQQQNVPSDLVPVVGQP